MCDSDRIGSELSVRWVVEGIYFDPGKVYVSGLEEWLRRLTEDVATDGMSGGDEGGAGSMALTCKWGKGLL